MKKELRVCFKNYVLKGYMISWYGSIEKSFGHLWKWPSNCYSSDVLSSSLLLYLVWESGGEILLISFHEFCLFKLTCLWLIMHAWNWLFFLQVAKLLMDTSVSEFYPTLFVLVTDILDMVGELVWQRIKRRAEFTEDGTLVCNLAGILSIWTSATKLCLVTFSVIMY